MVDVIPTTADVDNYLTRWLDSFGNLTIIIMSSPLETPGQGPVVPVEKLPLSVTNEKAPIVWNAQIDVASLDELLSHETTLETGAIASSAKKNQKVFAWRVCPRSLTASGLKSRIAHIAEMFMYWSGEITFRMYITKAIFQQTKIIIAFVPTSSNTEPNYTADQLLGFHNRVIINPSNDSEAILPVPFVSPMNWLDTTSSTGWIIARLLQPIVVTQASNTDIPWTLAVSARPSSLRFRYILPPPAVAVAGDPDIRNQNDALTDTPVKGARQLYARMSTPTLRSQDGLIIETPLMLPQSSPYRKLKTAMFVPRNLFPSVLETLAGMRGTGSWAKEYAKMGMNALMGPPTTFSGELPLSFPTIAHIYPSVRPGTIVAISQSAREPGTYAGPIWISMEVELAQGKNVSIKMDMYVRVPAGSPAPVYGGLTPNLSIGLSAHGLPVESQLPGFVFEFGFDRVDNSGNYPHHVWKCTSTALAGFPDKPVWFETVTYAGTGALVWPDAAYANFGQRLKSLSEEVNKFPQSVDHVCLYTDAGMDGALTILRWLIDPNTNMSAECANALLSFTLCQGPSAFSAGRQMVRDQKLTTWSCYRLAEGDQVTPLAYLVKSSQCYLDGACLLADTVNGAPVVVDIQSSSHLMLTYVRDVEAADLVVDSEKRRVIQNGNPYVEVYDSQSEASSSTPGAPRRRRRHRLRRKVKKVIKAVIPCASEPSVSFA